MKDDAADSKNPFPPIAPHGGGGSGGGRDLGGGNFDDSPLHCCANLDAAAEYLVTNDTTVQSSRVARLGKKLLLVSWILNQSLKPN